MANQKPKEKKKLITKLRNKYRLVILNDDTFEEKLSLKLSRLNVFVLVGVSIIILIASTTVLIAFTPIREYIPGYSSTALRRKAFKLATQTDSLEQQLVYNQRYLLNIRNIIEGKPTINFADTTVSDSVIQQQLQKGVSQEESELRLLVEEEEQFNVISSSEDGKSKIGINFFTPVKGLVTSSFEPKDGHYGVDVVAAQNEVIKACQNGKVLFAEWTAETGHVLLVQHPNELVSVYKHNSSLLKKEGDIVRAGEPIAIIGDSGELSSGPHLHFELWFNGNPVNPENFISF